MSDETVTRARIVAALSETLAARPFVRAAWLAGSDATGRTDAWSDVDLMVVVEDERVEDCFAALRGALVALSPIAHAYRLPRPTWHGHDQEFLSLRNADPAHFVDVLVMKRSATDFLLEPERHGTPLTLFDRDGIVMPAPLDRAKLAARMARRLKEIRETFFLFQTLVTRAVRRGHPADAAMSYLALTLRPLVELLRMRHCPDRFDFGLRYLDRDLPPEVRREVEAIALPGTPERVEACRARAEALFAENLRTFDAGEWRLPGDPAGRLITCRRTPKRDPPRGSLARDCGRGPHAPFGPGCREPLVRMVSECHGPFRQTGTM